MVSKLSGRGIKISTWLPPWCFAGHTHTYAYTHGEKERKGGREKAAHTCEPGFSLYYMCICGGGQDIFRGRGIDSCWRVGFWHLLSHTHQHTHIHAHNPHVCWCVWVSLNGSTFTVSIQWSVRTRQPWCLLWPSGSDILNGDVPCGCVFVCGCTCVWAPHHSPHFPPPFPGPAPLGKLLPMMLPTSIGGWIWKCTVKKVFLLFSRWEKSYILKKNMYININIHKNII